jgi:hypothetical protein
MAFPMQRVREFLAEWEISSKSVLFVAGVIALLAFFVVAPYLMSGGVVSEVKGTVVAPFDEPSSSGESYYMRVKLQSGREVRVPISRTRPVVPGKQVVLTVREGTRLGIPIYSFARYADN